MELATLMERLSEKNVVLKRDSGRLLYHPRGAIGPELMEALRLHKPAILALLADGARASNPKPKTQNPQKMQGKQGLWVLATMKERE